jgi:hypothetical protein
VPFLAAPPSPDEGGFLVVASQWHPGPSLYGHYWVDRPPLLIAVFAVADALGGRVALRVIGVVAVLLAIGVGAVVGWYASGRRSAGAAAAAWVVAVFLATPLFGTRMVDGELLSAPLVLGGLATLFASYDPSAPARRIALRASAGALGAGAFLVKQNMVDVLLVAAVLGIHTWWRKGLRRAVDGLLPVAIGAMAATGAVAAFAASRGTSLTGLWAAVVTFRFAAAQLLGVSGDRLSGLVHAYVVSGALVVTVSAGLVCLGSRSPPTVGESPRLPWGAAAATLTAWELTAALAGGSYWTHYLIGLIPGMALLVAVALRVSGSGARLLLVAVLAYAGVATSVAWSRQPVPPTTPTDDQTVAGYIRDHARSGDSLVVAFGHADIVDDTGLGSPYPYLWTLPAFVRDPRLTELDRLLLSPAAPAWFVAGGDLSQWGPPGAALQRTVEGCYTAVLHTQRWTVMHRTTTPASSRGDPATRP